VKTEHTNSITRIVFLDDKRFATSSGDKSIKIWENTYEKGTKLGKL